MWYIYLVPLVAVSTFYCHHVIAKNNYRLPLENNSLFAILTLFGLLWLPLSLWAVFIKSLGVWRALAVGYILYFVSAFFVGEPDDTPLNVPKSSIIWAQSFALAYLITWSALLFFMPLSS